MKKQPKGFIALMSVIIIMAILMLIVASTSLTGFFSRFNILDSELKERSSAIASACVDEALLQLANDSSWGGNATTTLPGGEQCYVGLVQNNVPAAGQKTLKTRAFYSNFYTNLKVTIDSASLSVLSWQELPNF
jgi:hypothetical protein